MAHRLLLSIIIIFLFINGSTAQTKFFFEVSGNYPVSKKMEESSFLSLPIPGFYQVSTLTQDFDTKPGIDLSVGMSKNISEKFSFTTGIGLSVVRFKNTLKFNDYIPEDYPSDYPYYFKDSGYGNGDFYGGFSSTNDSTDTPRALFDRGYNWLSSEDQDKVGRTEILYITIPVGMQYSLTDKLMVGVGIKNSIIAYSRQVKQNYNNYTAHFGVYTDTSSDGLSNYLLSGDINLQYNLFKQLWLSTSYNHYFTPVFDEMKQIVGDFKYQTFTFGLKYEL